MTLFVYRRAPLVRWSLHKYKCLWGVGGKGQDSGGKGRGSSLQEGGSHTFTLRLGYSRNSILYQKHFSLIFTFLFSPTLYPNVTNLQSIHPFNILLF